MLTLVQFATLDSVASIYVPLVTLEPFLVLYFSALIVVLGIVLMNLITAVVVNSALEHAMQDKEMLALEHARRKKKFIYDVSNIFQRLDKDNSGQITREEFTQTMMDDQALLTQFLSIDDP